MELTNKEIKNIKKLKDKKFRRAESLFLVEGKKTCNELLNSKYKIIKTLSSNQEYSHFPNFNLIDYEVLKSIATTETPQDIICVCEIPKNSDGLPSGNSLILDNLQDPGNIGTLIRSAAAFNFLDVYLINCADVFSEKVIRSSMGAIFKVNIHLVDSEFIKINKANICDCLIGTNLNSSNLKTVEIKGNRVAVIIGNEGNGVSEDLLNLSDKLITLEMTNNVESLNASVAGSLLMFEIFKR